MYGWLFGAYRQSVGRLRRFIYHTGAIAVDGPGNERERDDTETELADAGLTAHADPAGGLRAKSGRRNPGTPGSACALSRLAGRPPAFLSPAVTATTSTRHQQRPPAPARDRLR